MSHVDAAILDWAGREHTVTPRYDPTDNSTGNDLVSLTSCFGDAVP